jgi:hypothetical protein
MFPHCRDCLIIAVMSWEAFRLTSKSPSELYAIMSPSGVDHLVREMLMDCWRRLPEEQKDIASWRKEIGQVWDRNLRVWSAIRKPSPEAFFQDLLPVESDGHLRQALVLCWMMLPRAGGRKFSDVKKIVAAVYERDVKAWEDDHRTFTARPARPAAAKRAAKKAPQRRVAKKATKKKTTPKNAAGRAARRR